MNESLFSVNEVIYTKNTKKCVFCMIRFGIGERVKQTMKPGLYPESVLKVVFIMAHLWPLFCSFLFFSNIIYVKNSLIENLERIEYYFANKAAEPFPEANSSRYL